MRLIMKELKLAGLGVAIWGLGLLWPEVNLVLAPPAMIGVVVVLVAYALDQHLDQRHDQEHKAGQDYPPQPTPPTPVALTQ
jgi:hypothetical protein